MFAHPTQVFAGRIASVRRGACCAAIWVGFYLCLLACRAEANVFASNIKLNGSTNNAAVVPGSAVQISYILNEPATAGAVVQVYSGSNIVQSFSCPTGMPGALAGSNSVSWNCTQTNGAFVPLGSYWVRIQGAAIGYPSWTNITDDGTNFWVQTPSAIAVDQNTNSLFYGRVFVSSSPPYPVLPATPGLFKFNADGSPADEGSFSTGGYPWSGWLVSPWKMSISGDDKLYINDFAGQGLVMAFDPVLTTNGSLDVFRPDNYPLTTSTNSGPFVHGAGDNTQIWMVDWNLGGVGVVRWTLGSNGVLASNDPGTVVVSPTNEDLNFHLIDLAVDTNGFIFTVQCIDGADSNALAPFPRLMQYAAYAGVPQIVPRWAIGANQDSLDYAYGLAVDPTARFAAVAARGDGGGAGPTGGEYQENGGISIFFAQTGVLITNINQDPGGATNQQYTDVAWDKVGNLYAADFSEDLWRVYSPPGANHSATVAVPIIQAYQAFTPPLLSAPTWSTNALQSTNEFQFALLGQGSVSYWIEESSDLANWTIVATNYSVQALRSIALPAPGQQGFFRAVVAPPFQ